MPDQANERTRLLENDAEPNHNEGNEEDEVVEFSEKDPENPRLWKTRWKYLEVFLVFLVALIGPMASSMFSPAIDDIAKTFKTDKETIIAGQTGFVCMLGIGPLLSAPMSETFGRRSIFLLNLAIFTILLIPTALSPNAPTFIAVRTLSGFFGSVGVANGGGTISDLFETSERATVFGFYLLGPLLGPTIGPILAAIILANLDWRWIFWVLLIISALVTTVCYFFLFETRALIVLEQRKAKLEKENPDKKYVVKGATNQSVLSKIASNSTRAAKILFQQPIVLIMSAYQALIFASMYSMYSNYSDIWTGAPYNFSTIQVGLAYLGPASGLILTSCIIVPFVDRIYIQLAERYNDGEGKPEYRLPLANIGAVFLPVSLFWFGWTLEDQLDWPIPLAATLLFGGSHVSIFNTCQNYYIDSFEDLAASALAAGAFLRSIVGGIVPLFAPTMFSSIGYGWGFSVFGIISVLLLPAPLLFYKYGGRLREKFAVDI